MSDLNNNVPDDIDIFICCASFEERCLVIPNFIEKKRIGKSLVCYNIDQDGKIPENKNFLLKQLPHSEEVKLHSDDPLYITNSLTHVLTGLKNTEVHKIVIDTTTFTHEGLLILIKLTQAVLSTSSIHILYVGAESYSYNITKPEEKWLTKGVAEVRTVMGFPGYFDYTQKNHLVVLFGFEVERTIKIIETFEPDVISIGLGSANYSINSNHYQINIERHEKLRQVYPLNTFEISLRNPFDCKDQILKQIALFPNHNKIIAPLNNKLSTVGAALAHKFDSDIQLCYAKGNLYNREGYAKASNKFYSFKI